MGREHSYVKYYFCPKMMTTTMPLPVITRSSAIAETARTIRSVIEVGRLTYLAMVYFASFSLFCLFFIVAAFDGE